MALASVPPPELQGHAIQLLEYVVARQNEHTHEALLELSELALERIETLGWVEPAGWLALTEGILLDVSKGHDQCGRPMPLILRQETYSYGRQRGILHALGRHAFGAAFATEMRRLWGPVADMHPQAS